MTPVQRKWLSRIAFLAALFIMVQAISLWQSRHIKRGPAPQFAATLALPVQGQNAVDLQSWRAQHEGRAVALYFWAEWCPICKMQAGAISSLMQHTPVLTVAMQSGDAAKVRAFLLQHQRPWPTAVDASGAIAQSFGVQGVPATIVLDAAGNIHSVSVGYTSSAMLRLKVWLAERA